MFRKQISDSDIRMDVRSYMAQHRIDMQRVQLRVFGGTVRMSGEVYHLGSQEQPVSLSLLESFERDVVMTRGVRHAFFDFENWKRIDGGLWEQVGGGRGSGGASQLDIEERFQETVSLDAIDEEHEI